MFDDCGIDCIFSEEKGRGAGKERYRNKYDKGVIFWMEETDIIYLTN